MKIRFKLALLISTSAICFINVTQTSGSGGPELYLDAEGNLGLNKGGADSNKGIVGRIGARWKW